MNKFKERLTNAISDMKKVLDTYHEEEYKGKEKEVQEPCCGGSKHCK